MIKKRMWGLIFVLISVNAFSQRGHSINSNSIIHQQPRMNGIIHSNANSNINARIHGNSNNPIHSSASHAEHGKDMPVKSNNNRVEKNNNEEAKEKSKDRNNEGDNNNKKKRK